jgi:2,4'-dihydroxyacetophenone dioxygenase
MATLFQVTGGYTYIDPHGVALGYEGVSTKLEQANYESVGLGKDCVRRLVRWRRARRHLPNPTRR